MLIERLISVDDSIVASLIAVGGAALIGIIADRIRLGTRVAVLESDLETEKEQKKRDYDTFVEEIHKLAESMKDIPTMLARMSAIVERNNSDIEHLQKQVFGGKY